jgi:hypothetical protein
MPTRARPPPELPAVSPEEDPAIRTGAEIRRPDHEFRRQNHWPIGTAPKTVALTTGFGAGTQEVPPTSPDR